MAISFNDIPGNIRVPFLYAEFDASRAQQGPSIQPYHTLILGQKYASGTQPAGVPVLVSDEAQARTWFGAGSHLHMMIRKYRLNDKVTPITAMAILDDSEGVAATGSLTFAGVGIQAGTLALYVAGVRIPVGISAGMEPSEVATAVAAAINASALSPVSAAVDGVTAEKVNLTAKHKGLLGNEIDIRLNYSSGDETPENLGMVIANMEGGAGNPDIATLIANIPEDQFNVIICPWTDSTNLTLLETELDDRWGPITQSDGMAFIAVGGTIGGLTTFGNGRNSKHVSCTPAVGPTPSWEWASAVAGQVARSAQADPGRPLQTLPLTGILAPVPSARPTWQERNTLLFNGISTWKCVAGTVQIDRQITMYQVNGAGASDPSYLDVETLFTLSYLRYDFRNTMLRKYPRHKLANDGTQFGPGQPVITPKIGKAEAISIFAQWEEKGLVEGIEQFQRDLIVERNVSDPNRLDFLLPPDLINQLRVIGAQLSFLL
jgi:phage tail sheath gpL-like